MPLWRWVCGGGHKAFTKSTRRDADKTNFFFRQPKYFIRKILRSMSEFFYTMPNSDLSVSFNIYRYKLFFGKHFSSIFAKANFNTIWRDDPRYFQKYSQIFLFHFPLWKWVCVKVSTKLSPYQHDTMLIIAIFFGNSNLYEKNTLEYVEIFLCYGNSTYHNQL